MKEIEHHEREAKKHLQQAKALRKDLRDSFAFLQDRKEEEPAGAAVESRSGMAAEQEANPPDVLAVGKPQRTGAKKKRFGRRPRGWALRRRIWR